MPINAFDFESATQFLSRFHSISENWPGGQT
jgi:hypothetical protein